MNTGYVAIAAFAATLSLTACSSNPSAPEPAYAPGLGEIMTLTGARHAKLWFAGDARNWPLAAYELDEIKEGLEDAGKFHPAHKSVRTPIPQLIRATMDGPLTQLEAAVKIRDREAFAKGYDALTAGCNACHQSAEFGFNVVTRPAFNSFPNQDFAPAL